MMKKIIFAIIFVTQAVLGQENGMIIGKVTEGEGNNEPLPFANVLLKGTTVGGATDFDGDYSIAVEEGSYTLVFSFVGYKTTEKQITVKAGETLQIDQKLSADSRVALEEVEISATTDREKESALLLEQKKAVAIKTSIGAQELAKKGVGDAASAVTRISAVSKQEGTGNIFVRGLGDRYNMTTLNGLPLPSNNPGRKNVNLAIFNTDIVTSIGVSKIFEAQNYGDFGGATIDIQSKNFRGSPYVKVAVGLAKVNSNVLAERNFYLQDGPGYFGFKTGQAPSDPTSPVYSTSWDRVSKNRDFNNSLGISLGKSFAVGEASRLNTFFTASFQSDSNLKTGVLLGGVNKQGIPKIEYNRKSYIYNTNTTVMGTVNYKVNTDHSYMLNSIFLNSSNQDYSEYEGRNIEFDGGLPTQDDDSGFIKRGTFVQTQLFINQLLGKHNLSESLRLHWAVGHSMVRNAVPDRMQNTFIPSRDGSDRVTFFANVAIDNHRYYQKLKENEFAANIHLSYAFAKREEEAHRGTFTIGYSGRFKEVDFRSDQYYFTPVNGAFTFRSEGMYEVDRIFTAENFEASTFQIGSITQEYSGNQYINAFFTTLRYDLTERLTAILGLRGELLEQDINFTTELVPQGGFSNYAKVQFLPSVSAKYRLHEKQNIKFAMSRSYTLPQFKEKAEMMYEEVGQAYIGNRDLYPSTNYNVDVSWEFFPSSAELISVNTFGKFIQNPINEAFLNSSSGDISYLNTGDLGTALGVELEVKKKIVAYEGKNALLNKLTFGLNTSYIYTHQDFNSEKVTRESGFGVNFTHLEGRLTGSSDLLLNADLSFHKRFSEKADILATLYYGYFSDTLRAIGTQGRGNLIDEGNQLLDIIIRSKLSEQIKVGLSAKNLLDPEYRRIQKGEKDILVNSFKKGVGVSLSLSYTF